MSLHLPRLQREFTNLNIIPLSRDRGATAYRLELPEFRRGREFAWAELLIPRGFPEHAIAKIMLSPDAPLRIPHVEESGALCIEGDPGPGSGLSADDRIRHLLVAFQEKFLEPWLTGKLDDDFQKEPLNYWLIEVERARSRRDPVRSVWTVDAPPHQPTVREGLLLLPGRVVIAAENELPITNRIVQSLETNATQSIRVLIADIPIAHTFTPSTWPRNTEGLRRLLKGRLREDQREQFSRPIGRRGRGIHRIVLLRNEICGFAYLLPEGPPTVVGNGAGRRAYPSLTTPVPLQVKRIDPSWTVGRDQHPEVSNRQQQHILVLGAGALGGMVVDHLAKAGVGFITLVDFDLLDTSNLGRHLLGAESITQSKTEAVANRVNLGYPATVVTPKKMTAERWLQENSLSDVDMVLDLTGEPDVRWHVDCARQQHSCPLLIGWMEPYAAAAHVCLLKSGTPWMQGTKDLMGELEAVTWPHDVIRQEPGCSSKFQSYTAAAAAHAVALVAENALRLIDGTDQESEVISWVRGYRFLDKNWPGLELRDWAKQAMPHDGILISRPFL
jgi:molybdopterin/thiamine biosynthesis adenylyltransferase